MTKTNNLNKTFTGAEIFIKSLIKENIKHIFGYPGGAVLHIYDEIFKQDKIEHILVRHEQAATHSADAYARVTGEVGVALVTSGPGLTNAVTGIATAYMDSVPMVIFSGQVPSQLIGTDAFQEVDAIGITRPCVKHSYLVKDVRKLAETIKKAFYLARTGRPGPVLIDLPKDMTANSAEFNYPRTIKMRSYNPNTKGHTKQIKKAISLLLSAKKPMAYTGGGVVSGNASKEMQKLVKKLNLPITNTLMGLGSQPASSENFLGMLGMHGSYEANMAMNKCDVLLAVGARFDDRITADISKFCPNASIIHIDVDPASISKVVNAHIPIVGDVKVVLKTLLELLEDTKKQADISKWWQQINEWQKLKSISYENSDKVIKPQFVLETLHKLTKGNAIITSDVGQHQMWTAQYYGFEKPRNWVNSGGLGTMGFGLPAAIGAKIARPKEDVFCITGDGSIQMMTQELTTSLQSNAPVKIICLNNGVLGMVKQWQQLFYDKRYSMVDLKVHPDFVKLAEAYGHIGINVTKPSEVEPALKKAISIKDKSVFLNFITLTEENVYPMIPVGAGHNEIILKSEEN